MRRESPPFKTSNMINSGEYHNNSFLENENPSESRRRSTTSTNPRQETNDVALKTPRRLTATKVNKMSAADVVFRGVDRTDSGDLCSTLPADDDVSWAEEMFSEAEDEATRSRAIRPKTTKITHSDIDWFSELEVSDTEGATPSRKRASEKKVKRKILVKRKSTGHDADLVAQARLADGERSQRGRRTILVKEVAGPKTPSRGRTRAVAPEEVAEMNRSRSKGFRFIATSRPSTPNSKSGSVASDGSAKSQVRSVVSEGSSNSRGHSTKRSEMMMMASPRKRATSRSQRKMRSTDFELPMKTDASTKSDENLRPMLKEGQPWDSQSCNRSMSSGCDLNQSGKSFFSRGSTEPKSSSGDQELDLLFKDVKDEERKSILDKSRKGPINDYRSGRSIGRSREHGRSHSLRSVRSMRHLASDDDLEKLIKKAQNESWQEMPESPKSKSTRKEREERDASRRRNDEEQIRRLSTDNHELGDDSERRGKLAPKKSTEYLPQGLSNGQKHRNPGGKRIDRRESPKGRSTARSRSRQRSLDYSLDHLGLKGGQKDNRLSSSASVQPPGYKSRNRQRHSSTASVPGDMIKPSKGRSPTSVLDGKPVKIRQQHRVRKESKDKKEWAGAIDDILHARRSRRESVPDSPRSQRSELLASNRASSSMHIRSNGRALNSMKSSSMHSLGENSCTHSRGNRASLC